jgi:hypothetical protein
MAPTQPNTCACVRVHESFYFSIKKNNTICPLEGAGGDVRVRACAGAQTQ